MYYKVIKNNKVIDVLDKLIYLKLEPKHKTMILTDENDAQAILSSHKNTMWHVESLYRVPVNEQDYDTVKLIEIDKYEYGQLRVLNMKSPETIIDEYNLLLLEMGVI